MLVVSIPVQLVNVPQVRYLIVFSMVLVDMFAHHPPALLKKPNHDVLFLSWLIPSCLFASSPVPAPLVLLLSSLHFLSASPRVTPGDLTGRPLSRVTPGDLTARPLPVSLAVT